MPPRATSGEFSVGSRSSVASTSTSGTYQLRHLTDFIWEDYNESLEATLGSFKSMDRSVAEAMMIFYIASSYPFVFSFNDFCRLINLQSEGDTKYINQEVLQHTKSDLEHFNLYKRDHLKYSAWKVKSNIAPFIALHNDLWTSFSQTPRPYYYHILMVFEVMSTVWLGKWYDLSQHHSLDFHFLGKQHFQDDDYKRHLISHEKVLSEEIPANIYWIMRNAYDKIGSGFVSWFNQQLTEAQGDPADYVEQRTKEIY